MVARPVHAVWVSILGPQGGGYVSTVAWPRGGVIFVGYVPADPAKLPEVRRLKADGSEFRPVTLPDDPACRRTSYQGFGALHDGPVGNRQDLRLTGRGNTGSRLWG